MPFKNKKDTKHLLLLADFVFFSKVSKKNYLSFFYAIKSHPFISLPLNNTPASK